MLGFHVTAAFHQGAHLQQNPAGDAVGAGWHHWGVLMAFLVESEAAGDSPVFDFPLHSEDPPEGAVKINKPMNHKCICSFKAGYCDCVGQPRRNRLSTLQMSTLSDAHVASVSTCKLTAVWMKWHVYRDPGSISCVNTAIKRSDRKRKAPSSALWLVYRAEIKQWEGLRQNSDPHRRPSQGTTNRWCLHTFVTSRDTIILSKKSEHKDKNAHLWNSWSDK